MSPFIVLYLVVGVTWGLLMYRKHSFILALRTRLGDEPVFWITILMYSVLWPIDAIGLLVFILRRLPKALWYTLFRPPIMPEFGLVCFRCHAIHRWLGTNEAMEEIGWKVIHESADPSHVYWFCPNCDPLD